MAAPPKPLDQLINLTEPGWPKVQAWLDAAKNRPIEAPGGDDVGRLIEVLDALPSRAKQVLLELQVTTRSPLGAIAFQTGGLLIDGGWVRLFGAGCARLEGDLARWNGLGPRPLVERFDGAMLVGHDALGGFFALDGGAFGDGTGAAYYLAPDTLEWEHLTGSYSALVGFLLQGDLAGLYGDLRWEGWARDVAALAPDRGFCFDPPLFAEAPADGVRARTELPMEDLLRRALEAAP